MPIIETTITNRDITNATIKTKSPIISMIFAYLKIQSTSFEKEVDKRTLHYSFIASYLEAHFAWIASDLKIPFF